MKAENGVKASRVYGEGGVSDRYVAPAKLTVSLRITGVRPDGFHLIDAEMVSVSLRDELIFGPKSNNDVGELTIVDEVPGGLGLRGITQGADNLVSRAMALAAKSCCTTLIKRIPAGAGLGGGSSDAAAVLRWAGVSDPQIAVTLGADVPFCLQGGRARAQGVGELLTSLPFVERQFVLLLTPISVSTPLVYRQWDALHPQIGPEDSDCTQGQASGLPGAVNDLQAAALAVYPALERWRSAFADMSGAEPCLAGSGSTWWVAGSLADHGLAGDRAGPRGDGLMLSTDGLSAPVIEVITVPSCWDEVT